MKYNLTVGIIGTGYIGKRHIDALKDTVEKLVICDADIEGGTALANELGCKFYSDYEEMFKNEKLDYAVVCLPTHLHYGAVMKAFEYGINVLCEKPFASDAAQAEEMVRTAKEKGVTLMVGHCVRFLKPYEYLRRCVKDGRFGKLISLDIYRHGTNPSWSVGGWLRNPALSGGVVRDFHIHDTDILTYVLGIPKSVRTFGNPLVCHSVFDYADDISVCSSASWRNVTGFEFVSGYDAIFEKACIKRVNNKIFLYTADGESEPLLNEEFSEFFESDKAIENEEKYFCYCIANGLKPDLCPPEESVNTMVVNCAEVESMKSGVQVDL